MKLTGYEVENLVWEHEVERIQGEDRRWSRTNTSIVMINDKTYSVYWEHGLTEGQDNEYESQTAIEVKQVEEVTILKTWVNV